MKQLEGEVDGRFLTKFETSGESGTGFRVNCFSYVLAKSFALSYALYRSEFGPVGGRGTVGFFSSFLFSL